MRLDFGAVQGALERLSGQGQRGFESERELSAMAVSSRMEFDALLSDMSQDMSHDMSHDMGHDMGHDTDAKRSAGRRKQGPDSSSDESSRAAIAGGSHEHAPLPDGAAAAVVDSTYGYAAPREIDGALGPASKHVNRPAHSLSPFLRGEGWGEEPGRFATAGLGLTGAASPSPSTLPTTTDGGSAPHDWRSDFRTSPIAPFDLAETPTASHWRQSETCGGDARETPAIVVRAGSARSFETHFPPLLAQIMPVQTSLAGDVAINADPVSVRIVAAIEQPSGAATDGGRRSTHADTSPAPSPAPSLHDSAGVSAASTGPPARSSGQGFDRPALGSVSASRHSNTPVDLGETPNARWRQNETSDDDSKATPVIAVRALSARSFETHFPLFVVQNPPVQIAPASNADPASVRIDAAIEQPSGAAASHGAAPVKILAFQLEPGSLGAMTVRMRMSRSHIDLQIRVDSADALHLLGGSRDKLLEAIESTGVKVESFTVQIGSAPASADKSDAATGGASRGDTSDNGGRGDSIGRDGADSERKREHHGGRPPAGAVRRQLDAPNLRGGDRLAGVYL